MVCLLVCQPLAQQAVEATVSSRCITVMALAKSELTFPLHVAIIVTRGTGELQGPSIAFRTMVSQALSQAPGGVEYDTVYVS